LGVIKEIAEKYGDGTIHITIRQGFEIPGIPFEKMDEVNQVLASLIRGLETDRGVPIEHPELGIQPPAPVMFLLASGIESAPLPTITPLS
jgi:hypothetical protein